MAVLFYFVRNMKTIFVLILACSVWVPASAGTTEIEAVRANDPAKRNAPIEEGAKSATLMHLGNISYRLGRTLTFDGDKMECVGDHEANAMFKRKYRAPYVVPDSV